MKYKHLLIRVMIRKKKPVGVVVRAAWDPKGPEFKPRWLLELIHTRRLTQPVILPRSVK